MLIPRGVLALRNVAAQEKTRYAMNGLLLTRTADGKAEIVATNGKMLALARFDDAPDVADYPSIDGVSAGPRKDGKPFFVVPNETIQAAEKALPRKAWKAPQKLVCVDETTRDDEPRKLATFGATMDPTVSAVRPVEGYFPPYADVIPRAGNGICITFNASMLLTLAEALTDAAEAIGIPCAVRRGDVPVTLEMKDPQSAILVHVHSPRGENHPGVTGVLMPINSEHGNRGWSASALAIEGNKPETPQDANGASSPQDTPAPVPSEGNKPEAVQDKPSTDPAPESSAASSPQDAPNKPEAPKRKGGRKPKPRCATCDTKMPTMPESGLCAGCQDSRDFGAILALAANDRESLRACDVDRVMSAANERGAGFLARFRSWMLGGFGVYRPGTCGALTSWRPEHYTFTCAACKNPHPERVAKTSKRDPGAGYICEACAEHEARELAADDRVRRERDEMRAADAARESSPQDKPEAVTLEIREARTGTVETATFVGTERVAVQDAPASATIAPNDTPAATTPPDAASDPSKPEASTDNPPANVTREASADADKSDAFQDGINAFASWEW
jgi:hypothetical protein